jgi:hypothetical protein
MACGSSSRGGSSNRGSKSSGVFVLYGKLVSGVGAAVRDKSSSSSTGSSNSSSDGMRLPPPAVFVLYGKLASACSSGCSKGITIIIISSSCSCSGSR